LIPVVVFIEAIKTFYRRLWTINILDLTQIATKLIASVAQKGEKG